MGTSLLGLDWQTSENRIQAWACFYEGLVCQKNQCWSEAAEQFHLAARLEPQQPRIYQRLAESLFELHHESDALVWLQQAEAVAEPEDYLLYFDMGTLYQKLGLLEKARECYRKALEIFPKFEKGQNALATLPQLSMMAK